MQKLSADFSPERFEDPLEVMQARQAFENAVRRREPETETKNEPAGLRRREQRCF